MKKIILIAVAFLAIQATAQERKNEHRGNNERSKKMNNLSAEEIATLQTKKMTLHLDLNESQQAEIHKINLKNAEARKKGYDHYKALRDGAKKEKPSKEERLKRANQRLDYQIATKQKMKSILNDTQYAKWEKSQVKRAQRGKARMKAQAKKSEHKGR